MYFLYVPGAWYIVVVSDTRIRIYVPSRNVRLRSCSQLSYVLVRPTAVLFRATKQMLSLDLYQTRIPISTKFLNVCTIMEAFTYYRQIIWSWRRLVGVKKLTMTPLSPCARVCVLLDDAAQTIRWRLDIGLHRSSIGRGACGQMQDHDFLPMDEDTPIVSESIYIYILYIYHPVPKNNNLLDLILVCK